MGIGEVLAPLSLLSPHPACDDCMGRGAQARSGPVRGLSRVQPATRQTTACQRHQDRATTFVPRSGPGTAAGYPEMAEYLDHMLAIFPFEAEHFRQHQTSL
jgi:hypothetical protein